MTEEVTGYRLQVTEGTLCDVILSDSEESQPLTGDTSLPFWMMCHCYLPLLVPLSWLYQLGLGAYLLPYRTGVRRRHRLPCRVVSVGNLTFGGTGKSPMVRALCLELLRRGHRPAVLSRGHGGRMCAVGGLVSDGERRLMDAADCGDEPALLADALKGVPVAIGKDRRKSGVMIVERFHPDVIVLDDGMQYWQLHRDVEIVLVNAASPFGTGRVLPAGTLREPVTGIGRADAVVVTGCESVPKQRAESIAEQLRVRAPRAQTFFARKEPSALIDCETGERLPVSTLQGMKVVAVSGIANPESFEDMLTRCGAEIVDTLRFGDHCPYTLEQVEKVENAIVVAARHPEGHAERSRSTKGERQPATLSGSRRAGPPAVVTTAKDAVKLRLGCKMFVLDVDMVVENMDALIQLVAGSPRVQVGSDA